MLIRDIIPPNKIEDEEKKEVKVVPVKKDTYFLVKKSRRIPFSNFLLPIFLSLFFALFFIFFLNVDFSVVKNFLKSAIGGEEVLKNFYSANCEGDWQNPENAVGVPEVLKDGSIDSFSQENSALYKVGTSNIICNKFKEFQNIDEKNPCGENNENCEIESPKIYFSFAINENSQEQSNYNVRKNIANKVLNATKGSLSIKNNLDNSDLDPKAIIWYSLDDGKNWYSLEKITTIPMSNYLNGDYISFDAPFLKNWQDIQNLKLKIEGVFGGEENNIIFLDSAWVGVTPIEKSNFKEKIFSMFQDSENKVLPEKLEIIQQQFEYNIPSDGKIVATVKDPNGKTDGIFRIRLFSEKNELLSVIDVFSSQIIDFSGYNVPNPSIGEIKRSLFLTSIGSNEIAINLKKDWEKVKISIDYIPFSGTEDKKIETSSLDNLELNFYPSPISIENIKFLGGNIFNLNEKTQNTIEFSNEKRGEIIIQTKETEDSKGAGAFILYLDGRGIAILEGGYPEGKTELFTEVLPGEHELLIKNVDSVWEDNQGQREIKVYFREKND